MKIKFLIFATVFATFANAQFFEGFENGVPGMMIQKFQNEETTWIDFGLAAFNVEKPITGENSALFFNGMTNKAVVTSLETPILDLSSLNARLEFLHLQKLRNLDYSNKLVVELSNDSGKTWIQIGDFSDTDDNIKREFIDLTLFKPSKQSKIRFKATQLKVDMGYPIVIDDIKITNNSLNFSKKQTQDQDLNGSEIIIFPNPSNGKFHINALNTFDFKVIDINGKVIKKAEQFTKDKEVDLSEIGKGFYFIKIMENNIEKTRKIIIN